LTEVLPKPTSCPDEFTRAESSTFTMPSVEVWCRVTVLLPEGTELCTWELSGMGNPQVDVVDRLARMQLAVSRAGGRVVLRDLCSPLAELFDLVGLGWEMRGEPEGGKELRGVEEGVELADPPV
jgi:hypothetical protein